MRARLFASVAMLVPPSWAQSTARLPEGVVEISPDLFLLVHRFGRLQDTVDMQLETLRRANDFAASRGGVVVPVTLQYSPVAQRAYQYQFRVTSREQALALKPVLAESLIAVHNTGTCASEGNVIAALSTLNRPPGRTLELVALPPMLLPGLELPRNDPPTPGICLPGQVCAPDQHCLPGWQCSPGMPPTPEPLPAPPTASLR